MGWWVLGSLALWFVGVDLVAHGPEHEQIVLLTGQLARRPDDLAARLRRGELLRDHARVGGSNELAAARDQPDCSDAAGGAAGTRSAPSGVAPGLPRGLTRCGVKLMVPSPG